MTELLELIKIEIESNPKFLEDLKILSVKNQRYKLAQKLLEFQKSIIKEI